MSRLNTQLTQTTAPAGTLTEVLRLPVSNHFAVQRLAGGEWSSGHADSAYAQSITANEPFFMGANGSILAQVAPDGSLRLVAVFNGETKVDAEKRPYPGGWVTWKRRLARGPGLSVELGGTSISPSGEWPVKTAFLLNAIPTSTYLGPELELQVVTCAPISSDGSRRPRGLVWAARIHNTSGKRLEGTVKLVKDSLGPIVPVHMFPFQVEADHGALAEETSVEDPCMAVHGLDDGAFDLPPGGDAAFFATMTMPEDAAAVESVTAMAPDAWIAETCRYWQRVTGTFTMAENPLTAELFTRCNVLSLQSGCLNERGDAVGVLYGLAPFGGLDNFRDSFYAVLPAAQRDPGFFRPFIKWNNQYSTHPPTTKWPLGVTHSLGNSLCAAMQAGLYFQATADRAFFTDNLGLVSEIGRTLEAVLATRAESSTKPWLFHSGFISDGYSLEDYHTGSNLCLWFAMTSMADVLELACGDQDTARRYRRIAERIRVDLDRCNILPSGPFGPQYVEGTNADGSVPVMVHDGEESDVTLMPFYGYCQADEPAYLNFMRFAVSSHNVAYCEGTDGIVWETYGEKSKIKPVGEWMSDATFPGYITALAGCVDAESLRGARGYLRKIQELTDVNGSFWWWPYLHNKPHDEVRRHPFECGWAEGTFALVFQANFLGLSYDAPRAVLRCAPNWAVGDFCWQDATMGNRQFSVRFADITGGSRLEVENPGPTPIEVHATLPAVAGATQVLVDQTPCQHVKHKTYLGHPAVEVVATIPKHGKVEIQVS